MMQIPQITKYLLLINIAAYFLTFILGGISGGTGAGLSLNGMFGLHFFMASNFHFYQLFTYMFMHGSFTHLFFNMFALWMFGCVVENVWGGRKFLLYYILCGVGAGLFQELAQFVQFYMICQDQISGFSFSDISVVAQNSTRILNAWTTVGASGAIYGILLAFGMLFPEQHIFIFPLPIPIKAKWFVCIYAGVELFSALSTTSDGVAHVAHLGGMIVGYFLIRHWKRNPESYVFGARKHSFYPPKNGVFGGQKHRSSGSQVNTGGSRVQSDWDYNAEKVARQQQIDAILDKIRKSGYDSLTTQEKQALFDNSKNF